MKIRSLYAILGCLALLAAIPVGIRAQSIVTGAVSGAVTDPTGAVVATATVTLVNTETGVAEQPLQTNTSGDFLFPLLKPGNYLVTVTMAGFRSASSKVEVSTGMTATVNLKLEVGASSQTVEVVGAVQGVQSEDANVSTDLNLKVVQNVPNPGGDMTYYAQLAPGITMATSQTGGTGSYGNFSADGLPATSNLFTIDGTDYNDPFLDVNNSGSSNLLLGSNDIDDVAVVTNGYTGQYGRQAGAQVNYTTNNGTNAFHGNAIYNWNGSALNANDFFLNSDGTPKPFENNNSWAAALGGPIKRNKLFFYVDTEGLRYIFGTATETYLPTAALESYIIDTSLPGSGNSAAIPFYESIFKLYNGAPGASRATPVATGPTAATDTCGGLGGPPVPVGSGSGSGTMPTPFATTPCLESYFTSSSDGNREWLLISRVDYDISEKDKIFFRAKVDQGVQPTYADPIDSKFNILSVQPAYDGQVNYTHIFSPNVVNSFIGSILYYSAYFGATSTGLPSALAAFPYNLSNNDTSMTALGFGSGIYPGYALFPEGRNVTGWQLVDDLSIQHGNHTFKMGVNFRRDDISDYSAEEGSFPGVSTSLADFAVNIADEANMSFATNVGQPIAYSSLGLYFQDEARLSSKLKLTLALRFDPGFTGTCQDACNSIATDAFNDSPHDPVGDELPINQLMTTGIKQILPSVEKLALEPRFGMAWTPFDKSTVIRSGVGLFLDAGPGAILDNFTRNSPTLNAFDVFGAPLAPADPDNAQALLTACNTAYNTAFKSGDTVDEYLDSTITLGPLSESASDAGCGTPGLTDVVRPLVSPKYIEWNFEIQHSFGPNSVFSLNYVGNHGYDEVIADPYLNSFYEPGMLFSADSFGNLPASVPDTRVLNVIQFQNTGVSNYNGLTASYQIRAFHGLQASVNYTYSHALDDDSTVDNEYFSYYDSLLYQIDPYNLQKYNYASADFDARHMLTAHYEWTLPFKTGSALLNEFIGGWTISETFFLRSGFPYSLVDGDTESDLANDNTNVNDVTVFLQPTKSIPMSCTDINPATPCWTAADFNPSPTTFATQPRNQYRGPGYFNTDLTVHKTFRINERMGLTIGAVAYNVLNHVNFANPNNNSADSNFGYISATTGAPTTPYGSFAGAATDMRILQLTGKLTF